MKLTITIQDEEQRTVMRFGEPEGARSGLEPQGGAAPEGPFDGGPARAAIESEESVPGVPIEYGAGSSIDAGPAPGLRVDGQTGGQPPASTGAS